RSNRCRARPAAMAGSAPRGGMRRRQGTARAARRRQARRAGTKSCGIRELEVLRRRRGEDADQAGPGETRRAGGAEETGAGQAAAGGPWDVNDDVPPAERIDFGSMQVPVTAGCEVQVSMADDQVAWITVVRGDSGLQLQAFAAPKTGGLWADVRQEIAAEVAKTGGPSGEADGPFGVEGHARPGARDGVPGAAGGVRRVGSRGGDGPRGSLRGVIGGPAARRAEIAAPLEQVFADVVVARGDHPVPPRDMLEIRLPAEALQALAGEATDPEEAAAPEGNRWRGLDPFQRGPAITEAR